ncbi:GlsB/YeaQ/YmgE family stress response membrane protein [Microbispora cellulosiformans]|uniref:GlsB/YeaQ/YmgE family stress response membrane protein n=1 Tax=Microbispora cellulosiformans TaxID=2614688 RepID=A0A5J5KB67_9ACTN|nr:GlsB/YeaQ/YmgE family stress response membrane protein [Microbispora cellulosiformans]KAA9381915.1 GlsB/YeaQ/YmgE family stress response membrane protein [Microbispora cellulosiformans]
MTIASILGAIIVGAIVGAVGRLLLPGRQPIGWVLTIVVGIVAALIGTAIAQAMGVATTDGIDWIELVMQVVLAVVGVGIVAGLKRGSRV